MSRVRDIANILSGVSTDMATDAEVTSSIASHAAAADPHTVYLKESEFNAAGKNFLINGLFDIWQRSTDVTNSLSMGTFYAAADRWQNWVGTSCNTRYQRISNADPGVSQYSYRIQRVAGVTTATNYQFSQNIETSVAKLLVGKTVTLSFRVKKGANWSDADGTMSARVAYNDNTDGNVITQAATTAFSNTFTPTTSFATYSVTGTIPSSGVSTIMVNFFWEPTGTAGADDWLEFSAVQLEIGSAATPFSRAGGNIQGELAACQRYCYLASSEQRTAVQTSQNNVRFFIFTPVIMRSMPSLTISNPTSGNTFLASYPGTAYWYSFTTYTGAGIVSSGTNGYAVDLGFTGGTNPSVYPVFGTLLRDAILSAEL